MNREGSTFDTGLFVNFLYKQFCGIFFLQKMIKKTRKLIKFLI